MYCPIWVKLGVNDRHVILLGMYEFRDNRRKDGCASMMSAN